MNLEIILCGISCVTISLFSFILKKHIRYKKKLNEEIMLINKFFENKEKKLYKKYAKE